MLNDMTNSFSEVAQEILRLIPQGGSVGNGKAKAAFSFPVDQDEYNAGKQELLAAGVIVQGRGRGGSIRRTGDVVAVVDVPPAASVAVADPVAPAPAPVAPAVPVAAPVSEGGLEVVRPLVNKPHLNMGPWINEVIAVLAEHNEVYPGLGDIRDKIRMNQLNTDVLMEFHAKANDVMTKVNGCWFHFELGLVKNK